MESRPQVSWIVVAHVIGAVAIGLVDAIGLGSAGLAAATLPLFAAVGLLAALAIAGAERGAARTQRWWLQAIAIAAPSLLVTGPMCSTLFDGAKAQTFAARAVACRYPRAARADLGAPSRSPSRSGACVFRDAAQDDARLRTRHRRQWRSPACSAASCASRAT